MKPKQSLQQSKQHDLFRSELANMIDPNHSLVKLAKAVDWKRLEDEFGESYCPDNGRPAISTGLIHSRHILIETGAHDYRLLRFEIDFNQNDIFQGALNEQLSSSQ